MPTKQFTPASTNVGEVSEPCPLKCGVSINVRDRLTKKGIDGVSVELSGASGPPKTDVNGFANFAGLDPKEYVAKVNLAGLESRYALPTDTSDSLTKTIEAGGYEFFVFELEPLTKLEVTVARKERGGGVKEAKVTITGDGGLNETKTTSSEDGKVVFDKLKVDKVEVIIELEGETKKSFVVDDAFDQQKATAPESGKRDVKLDRKLEKNETTLQVVQQLFVQMHYEDPEKVVRPFPKEFAAKVVFSPSGAERDVKVLDDLGNLKFGAEKDQTHFTLKFDSAKLVLLCVGKDKSNTLVLDPDEAKLQDLTKGGARFFALPKKWSLVHAAWKQESIAVPKDGKIAIPSEGIGKADAPGKLTLLPVSQFVRFVYFDRKYGRSDHNKKQIHTPALVVKASRKSHATTGAPVDPIAGTHDAIGNWPIDHDDLAKGCQAISWVVTKSDSGDDLAKLDNTMLIEIGWENGFVVAKSATERAIETFAEKDIRRAFSKNRTMFYDLPKLWRSKCYYTRLPGGDTDLTKNKFFDELTEDDIAKSLVKTTPLLFSLDDIVLTDNSGSQAVKDKNRSDTAIELSKHSRVAMLHVDPDDKYNVKVWNPQSDAVYHSKTFFVKESATTVFRNVLVEYPDNLRCVIFCNGVYDVFDKRSTSGDFSKKHLQGARAAKLNDADISTAPHVFANDNEAFANASTFAPTGGAGYVHMPRGFPISYLHYADTDGTTVYGMLISMYSLRFFGVANKPSSGPASWLNSKPLTTNLADVRNYRNAGLKTAMDRWNGKHYHFEENDDKAEVVVKSFFFFEAKDVEDPLNTFNEAGGKNHCYCAVGGDNSSGSSATATDMFMRQTAFRDEGSGWGSMPPGSDPAIADYDGATASARCAFAHELGHAVVGLFDDYLTSTLAISGSPAAASALPSYAKAQRFEGVPYYHDPVSMMSNNRAVRLRGFWGRALWLNAEAKTGGKLHKFLKERTFRAAYEPGSKEKLKFFMPGGKSIYAPVKSATNFSLGEQGKANLYLYELGDDEFSRWMQNGPYDAILVVDWRLCATFVDVATPTTAWSATANAYTTGATVTQSGKHYRCLANHTSTAGNFGADAAHWEEIKPCTWTAAKKKTWIEDIAKVIRKELEGDDGEGRFKLTTDGTYKKVYVRNFAQWCEKASTSTSDPSGTQFTIVVTGDGTANFKTATSTINVGSDASAQEILRYILGRYAVASNKKSTLEIADLDKLKAWVASQTGSTAACEDIPIAITTVTPATGEAEGASVTITGTNLTDVTSVKFGDIEQKTFNKTSTSITTTVPASAITAKIKVASSNRDAESPAEFKVHPVISSFEPTTPVAVGGAVTIKGTSLTGATSLKFGSVSQTTFTVVSVTEITTTVPANAVSAKIEVTTPGGSATSSDEFKVIPPPKITSFAPTTAKVGASVTINGTGLDAATVTIGTKPAALTENSATKIVATVAADSVSGSVEVKNAGGEVTSGGFTLDP
jgi:hypothetical protein